MSNERVGEIGSVLVCPSMAHLFRSVLVSSEYSRYLRSHSCTTAVSAPTGLVTSHRDRFVRKLLHSDLYGGKVVHNYEARITHARTYKEKERERERKRERERRKYSMCAAYERTFLIRTVRFEAVAFPGAVHKRDSLLARSGMICARTLISSNYIFFLELV